jgi:hypothetical protein
MSTPEAIRELEETGYSFRLAYNGQISAVGKPGPDARVLLNIIFNDFCLAIARTHLISIQGYISVGFLRLAASGEWPIVYKHTGA